MPSLLDIKARIGAVQNIKKITRAMQLVAAAKFNRAQGRARSARPYSREIDAILSTLASMSDDDGSGEPLQLSLVEGEKPLQIDLPRLFEQRPMERPGLVLFTSDRGLAGSFNTRLIRAATDFMKTRPGCRLITIGRKGNAYFKRRDVEIIHHEEGLSDKLLLEEIKRLTYLLLNLFVSGEVDGLYLIYAQFKSAMVSDIVTEQFLSIPPVSGKDAATDSSPVESAGTTDTQGTSLQYILEPDRDAVYETLIPLYATTKVFATLADSFASEYGARMTAMQLATKNAEEMLDSLVILRNRMRQAAITKELAEIVGGAESLG
jgi:F-type H+-transporting ATPase subunit gamma